MANEPENFADKVINSLIKQSKAVDLTAEEAAAKSADPVPSGDFVAYGAPSGGGTGPGAGGNKDIVIIPGYTGTAATSVSQINFYWSAPNTPDATGVDNNIRATIYNFATNPGSGVTRSVLAFGGYDGANQYKPTPTYGGGTGITSKIFIDPFLGKIDTDFIGFNSTGVASTTDVGTMSYDTTQNRIRVGTGAGSAKTVAYTDDVSSVAGLATTAQNVNIVTTNTGTFYPLFTSSTTTASGAAVSIDGTDISYNAATNVLTAGQFSGLHSGAAATFTNIYGPLTGTATTAQNVFVTNQTTGTFYPTLSVSSATANGVALGVDANLSFDAATNTLTSGKFDGLHSGAAATFTNIYGALTGIATTAGLATTSQNVNIVTAATGTFYPLFTSASTTASGVAVSIDGTDVSYNFATNTFTAGKFDGLHSGAAATFTNIYGTLTGNVTGTATTAQNVNVVSGATGTFYPLFTSASATASGVAVSINSTNISYNFATNTLTAGTFSGNLSATAATATNFYGTLTGNVTGTATTSQNVYVTAQTTGTFYPTFSVSSSTANGIALGVDSNLSFDAATNVLTAGQFSGLHTGAAGTFTNIFGTLTGNVTGTATTALNLALQNTSQNASHLVPFTLNSATSGSALSTNAGFSYNPNTGVLTVGTVTGTISGIASTSASALVANATANSSHAVIFSTPATSTGQAGVALSSSTNITYNPSGSGTFSLGSGQATINGLTLGATSNTITTSSGNLTLNASGGTVVIAANLNVQGTATYIDSTTQTITDPVIVLGSGAGGTHTNVTDTVDRGIEFRRFSGSAITGFFGQSNSSGRFTFIPNANLSAANTYTGSVGVIEANLTGTAVTATNFFGPLVGNAASATTAGLATTAQNLNIVATTTGTLYPLFASVSTTASGVAVSVDGTDISYNAATNTLTAGLFSGLHSGAAATFTNIYGPLTGTATTAQNAYVTAQTTGTFYPVFTNVSSTANGVALSVESALSYDAATDTLTAGKFSGLASGTAATFTNFYGTLNGNLTGTATTAANVNVVTTNIGTFYPLFTSASTTASGIAVSIDGTDISYNAATNTLTAGKFDGLHSGSAATFTNIYGALTGNVTGTATTAQNAYVTAQTTGTFYPVFTNVSSTANGVALSVESTLTWNAATDVLTAGQFSGLHTGTAATFTNIYGTLNGSLTGTATTAQNVNVVTTNTGTFYPLFTSASTTASGIAVSIDGTDISYNAATNTLTAGKFDGLHAGAAATFTNIYGPLTGTATTAQNVFVTNQTTGTFYPTLSVSSATANGIALGVDANLSFDAATNTLTSGKFDGLHSGTAATFTNIYGTLVGTATSAANLNVVAAGSAGAHYLLMSPTASGSGIAVSTDAQLSYVPSTDTLTVSNINNTTVTAAGDLSSGTYLTIKTTSGDDNSTTDFFIRGITSGSVSKFSVDANGNLRATTKSFDIEHPTKPGMRLVYGVLEGPEHGVYHRGTVEGKGELKVMLPEYWSKLVCPDYSVQLTPWGNYSVHIVEKSTEYFTIVLNGNAITRALKNIKVDYIVHGSRLDAPLETEQ